MLAVYADFFPTLATSLTGLISGKFVGLAFFVRGAATFSGDFPLAFGIH